MKKPKKKGMISVDFTDVEAGSGGGKLLPEGSYQFEIKEIEERIGEESKAPYLSVTFEVAEDGEYQGTKAYDNVSLQPQSLWKLRGLLEAAGIETVDGPMDIDPDELVGLIVVGDIIHEEYKGKTKHRVNGYSIAEEAAPASGPKKKKAAADDDDKPTFKVKQSVAFREGKKRIVGVVTKIDGDDVEVRVGKEEYEMKVDDLEAA